MNHARGYEGHIGDRRGSSGVLCLTGAAALNGVRRGLPGAMSGRDAADAIAEDPAKLRLAGRLISWATAGNDVRFEKVASLQQSIEEGTYGVTSADLAPKLMGGMRG